MYCKLDRVMGNESWMEMFPMTEVNYMPEGDYDHCPMILRSFPSVNKKKLSLICGVTHTSF